MRLAFGAGLCRFGMFRAVRAASPSPITSDAASDQNSDNIKTATI